MTRGAVRGVTRGGGVVPFCVAGFRKALNPAHITPGNLD